MNLRSLLLQFAAQALRVYDRPIAGVGLSASGKNAPPVNGGAFFVR